MESFLLRPQLANRTRRALLPAVQPTPEASSCEALATFRWRVQSRSGGVQGSQLTYLVLQEILVENGKAAATLGNAGSHVGMPRTKSFRLPPGITLLDVNDSGIE